MYLDSIACVVGLMQDKGSSSSRKLCSHVSYILLPPCNRIEHRRAILFALLSAFLRVAANKVVPRAALVALMSERHGQHILIDRTDSAPVAQYALNVSER